MDHAANGRDGLFLAASESFDMLVLDRMLPGGVDAGWEVSAQTMAQAMACFVVNDALVKYVSQSLPAAQLIFIRGLFATTLLLAVAWTMGLLRQDAPAGESACSTRRAWPPRCRRRPRRGVRRHAA